MGTYILYVNRGDGTSSDGAIPVCVTPKRVKNLNLRVRPDGSVALSTPLRTPRGRAQVFLDERASWIYAHVAKRAAQAEERAAASEQPLTSYPLWGETVTAATPLSPAELDQLYRIELEQALPTAIAWAEPLIGAHASRWFCRKMRTRWGSCTPKTGRIRINTRLAAYPPECLRYVVAHELAHLLEPSHNARFHAIVARAVPDEKRVRARLRQPATE